MFSRLQFKPINRARGGEKEEKNDLVWFSIFDHYYWHSLRLIFLPNFVCFQSLDELLFEHVRRHSLNSSRNKRRKNSSSKLIERLFSSARHSPFVHHPSFVDNVHSLVEDVRSLAEVELFLLDTKCSARHRCRAFPPLFFLKLYLNQLPFDRSVFILPFLEKINGSESQTMGQATCKRSVWFRNSFAWSSACRRRLISFS